MLVARAKCTYEVQRGAIATTRHALKLLSSRCFGERTRRGNELRRLCTHIEERDAFSAAWLVTLFPSFVLPFLLPFRATASPTAVRTLTCHWPCPLTSARSLVCLLGHLSVAPSLSFSLSFILFSSVSSLPSDSRVYSRAFAAFLRRSKTRSYLPRRWFQLRIIFTIGA